MYGTKKPQRNCVAKSVSRFVPQNLPTWSPVKHISRGNAHKVAVNFRSHGVAGGGLMGHPGVHNLPQIFCW